MAEDQGAGEEEGCEEEGSTIWQIKNGLKAEYVVAIGPRQVGYPEEWRIVLAPTLGQLDHRLILNYEEGEGREIINRIRQKRLSRRNLYVLLLFLLGTRSFAHFLEHSLLIHLHEGLEVLGLLELFFGYIKDVFAHL